MDEKEAEARPLMGTIFLVIVYDVRWCTCVCGECYNLAVNS